MTNTINDKILAEIEQQIDDWSRPYNTPTAGMLIILHNKLMKWQLDPQNDCLRSRGDYRWIKSLELEGRLQSLAKPF